MKSNLERLGNSNGKMAISTVLIVAIVIVVIVAAAGAYYLATVRGTGSSITSTSSSTSISSSSATTASPLILYTADAYVAEATTLENAFTASSGVQMVVPPKSGGSFTLGQEIAQGNPVSVFLSVAKSAVSESILNATFAWKLHRV